MLCSRHQVQIITSSTSNHFPSIWASNNSNSTDRRMDLLDRNMVANSNSSTDLLDHHLMDHPMVLLEEEVEATWDTTESSNARE